MNHTRTQIAGDTIHRSEQSVDRVIVDDVGLKLPDGQPLIGDVNLSLKQGDSVLLSGPSGVGKSTLLRAIAGIWPFGHGNISVPLGSRILFLPQRPYLPIGALRDVVNYPILGREVDETTLREALQAVELPELAERLDETACWAQQLSPGEQQRIAFARALVHKPDWLFLDEATSAVDEPTEAHLYSLLRERLPNTTLLSVGHRSTLRAFHSHQLLVQPNGTGPAHIIEGA